MNATTSMISFASGAPEAGGSAPDPEGSRGSARKVQLSRPVLLAGVVAAAVLLAGALWLTMGGSEGDPVTPSVGAPASTPSQAATTAATEAPTAQGEVRNLFVPLVDAPGQRVAAAAPTVTQTVTVPGPETTVTVPGPETTVIREVQPQAPAVEP